MSYKKILGFALTFITIYQICRVSSVLLIEKNEDDVGLDNENNNDISQLINSPTPDYTDFFLGKQETDIIENSREPRIVNGRNARRNEFPHQVAILFRNGPYFTFTCGGSIYNRRFIVTAAHCLEGSDNKKLAPENLRVIAGQLQVGLIVPTNSRLLIPVSNVTIHNLFDGQRTPLLLNDIGLLELAIPLNYSESVRRIRVAQQNEAITTTVADVAGWGRTEVHLPSGQPLNEQPLTNPLVLRTAKLRIIPRQICTVRYFVIIPENLLCVGSEGLLDSQSACYGDSGGPLICTSPGGQYLCGIVSIGPGCGLRFTPAFYTDVSKFNTWMTRIAGSQQI